MVRKSAFLWFGVIGAVTHALPAAAQPASPTAPSAAASDSSGEVQSPPADAENSAAARAPQADITVTGSRIVREGYQAPTPLSVIGEAQLATNANSNIAQYVTTLPAFSGSYNTRSKATTGSDGLAGINSLNLRSLGPSRTLVLVDGHRFPPVTASGVVDVNTLPQGLVSRIDVVTGGVSAVYGSDAVAGVVNFVLDRDFKGLKGEVSGGATNYGDGENYKVNLTGGFHFAGDRGRVFFSGEQVHDNGIGRGTDRAWTRAGLQTFVNPAATATNGQPARLILTGVGYLTAAPGGVIVSGPLANTAFGPNGVPYQQALGDIRSDTFMRGGDWQRNDNRQYASIAPRESRQNAFGRVAFDLSPNVEIYAQLMYNREATRTDVGAIYLPGTSGPLIQIDNAFLPTSVRTAMVAAGLTNVRIGTLNQDLGVTYQTSVRRALVFAGGLRGDVDLLGSDWKWDLFAQKGISRTLVEIPNNNSRANFALAVDAVRNPATGTIVCRSTLTAPTNGCSPYNVFGTGVNDPNGAGVAFVHCGSFQRSRITQESYSGSITGEPFSLWARPVSVALSVEHRRDGAKATVDPLSVALDHIYGNYSRIDGSTSVTEGAFETVVPILKDTSFVENWDFNAGVRYTSYSLAGNVVTWKVGTTFSPVSDVKIRLTRSRDIRAPNIQETFSPANTQRNTAFDPFTNTTPVFNQTTFGNRNLRPEKADTLGIGVVLQPSFVPGLTASVDFWDIKINDAISSVAPSDVLLLCFNNTRPDLCANITRANGVITDVISQNINFAQQHVRGLDFESSYVFALDSISGGLPGRLSLHGNATRFLKDYINSRVTPAQDFVGENGGINPPKWRFSTNVNYHIDNLDLGVTVRGLSSGTQFANYIECTSACPASTTAHPTVNDNHMAGRTYVDASIDYGFNIRGAKITAFFNVKNIFNRDPVLSAASINFSNGANPILYDVDGRVYRAGVRFRI